MDAPKLRFQKDKSVIKVKMLNDLVEVIDCQHSTAPITEEQTVYRMIRTSNVRNGRLILETMDSVNEETYHKWSMRGYINPEDIILTREAPMGEVAIVSDSIHEKLFLGQRCLQLKTTDKVLPYYMYLLLQSTTFVRYISPLKSSGSTVSNIRIPELKKFEFKIPDLKEQKSIADFFTLLNRRIELQQEKVEAWREYKKGMMQKLFSRELRFKDEGGQEFPEWETKNINDIFSVITDYVANGSFEGLRNNVSYSEKEDFAYVIRLQDASNNWKGPFVYTNEHAYEFLKKTELFIGDIIMSNVGSVGKFFKIPGLDKPMTLGPNALLLRSNKNNNEFLFQILSTSLFMEELTKKVTPGVQHKINKTDLKKICLDIPSIQEQIKIAEFLSKSDEKIELEQQKLQALQAHKKGFMQQMFI